MRLTWILKLLGEWYKVADSKNVLKSLSHGGRYKREIVDTRVLFVCDDFKFGARRKSIVASLEEQELKFNLTWL